MNRVKYRLFRRAQRATERSDLTKEVSVQTTPCSNSGSGLSRKEAAATQAQSANTPSANKNGLSNSERRDLYKELGRAEDEIQALQFQLDNNSIIAQAAQQHSTTEKEESADANELTALRIMNMELNEELGRAEKETRFLVDEIDSLRFQADSNLTARQTEQMVSACGVKRVTTEALASGACAYTTDSDNSSEEERYDLNREDRAGKSLWDY